MAFYLVTAQPRVERLDELARLLHEKAFVGLRPFGPTLHASLRDARRLEDGQAVWEEEDYCVPPLAQERAAALDAFFEDLRVERVESGAGWRRIESLPLLFPSLHTQEGCGARTK